LVNPTYAEIDASDLDLPWRTRDAILMVECVQTKSKKLTCLKALEFGQKSHAPMIDAQSSCSQCAKTKREVQLFPLNADWLIN